MLAELYKIRPKKLVLVYHSFRNGGSESEEGYVSDRISMPVGILEAHFSWLSEFADFVTLDEIATFENPNRWKIAVTLDDGYRNNITLGLPVFEKYEVPVTWFVCTDYIEKDFLPWWDLVDYVCEKGPSTIQVDTQNGGHFFNLKSQQGRLQFRNCCRRWFTEMSVDISSSLRHQLKKAVSIDLPSNAFASKEEVIKAETSPLVTIGGHTITHPNMAALNPESLRKEVYGGKCKLESWIGKGVKWFAYPYGSHKHWNESARKVVKSCGFRGAVTTVARHVGNSGEDSFLLPRANVPEWNLRRFAIWLRFPRSVRALAQIKSSLVNL